MHAELIRYLERAGQFKATLAHTTSVGQDAHQRLQASPIAIQLLTQAMTAALILVTEFKSEGTLSVKFVGNGPCGHLTVEANSQGEVRGFAGNLNVNFERDPAMGLFQQALGQGEMICRRREGNSQKVYTSTVPLIPGEMAANVTHYLLTSEQTHSAMVLGSKLDPKSGIAGSGGVLIQALPDANEDILFIVEDRLTTLNDLGITFAQESGVKAIEHHLFDGFTVQRTKRLRLAYRCHCSKERVQHLLSALPREQLQSLLDEQRDITLQCQFCTKPYTFSPQELQAVAKSPRKADS